MAVNETSIDTFDGTAALDSGLWNTGIYSGDVAAVRTTAGACRGPASGDSSHYTDDHTSSANCSAWAEISHDGEMTVDCRTVNEGTGSIDGYQFYTSGSGFIAIYQTDGAGFTEIDTGSDNTAVGNRIAVEANGSTITGYIDTGTGFSSVLSGPNGAVTNAGSLGFWLANTSAGITEFGGGPGFEAPQELVPGAIDASATLYNPTIANATAQELVPGAIDASVTLYNPTIANADPQELVPGAIDASVTLYGPTITNAGASAQELAPGAINASATLYEPTIENAAAQELAPGAIDASVTLYNPTIASADAQELAPGAIDASATLYNPTIASADAQELVPGAIDASATLYEPVLGTFASQELRPDPIGPLAQVYAPALSQRYPRHPGDIGHKFFRRRRRLR